MECSNYQSSLAQYFGLPRSTHIKWCHGCNSYRSLESALRDPSINMIEADISIGQLVQREGEPNGYLAAIVLKVCVAKNSSDNISNNINMNNSVYQNNDISSNSKTMVDSFKEDSQDKLCCASKRIIKKSIKYLPTKNLTDQTFNINKPMDMITTYSEVMNEKANEFHSTTNVLSARYCMNLATPVFTDEYCSNVTSDHGIDDNKSRNSKHTKIDLVSKTIDSNLLNDYICTFKERDLGSFNCIPSKHKNIVPSKYSYKVLLKKYQYKEQIYHPWDNSAWKKSKYKESSYFHREKPIYYLKDQVEKKYPHKMKQVKINTDLVSEDTERITKYPRIKKKLLNNTILKPFTMDDQEFDDSLKDSGGILVRAQQSTKFNKDLGDLRSSNNESYYKNHPHNKYLEYIPRLDRLNFMQRENAFSEEKLKKYLYPIDDFSTTLKNDISKMNKEIYESKTTNLSDIDNCSFPSEKGANTPCYRKISSSKYSLFFPDQSNEESRNDLSLSDSNQSDNSKSDSNPNYYSNNSRDSSLFKSKSTTSTFMAETVEEYHTNNLGFFAGDDYSRKDHLITAHWPTARKSDLTLAELLRSVAAYNYFAITRGGPNSGLIKGLKLDIKQTRALKPTVALIKSIPVQLLPIVWLNADIVPGSGASWSSSISAENFFLACAPIIRRISLSLGWTMGVGWRVTYSEAIIRRMLSELSRAPIYINPKKNLKKYSNWITAKTYVQSSTTPSKAISSVNRSSVVNKLFVTQEVSSKNSKKIDEYEIYKIWASTESSTHLKDFRNKVVPAYNSSLVNKNDDILSNGVSLDGENENTFKSLEDDISNEPVETELLSGVGSSHSGYDSIVSAGNIENFINTELLSEKIYPLQFKTARYTQSEIIYSNKIKHDISNKIDHHQPEFIDTRTLANDIKDDICIWTPEKESTKQNCIYSNTFERPEKESTKLEFNNENNSLEKKPYSKPQIDLFKKSIPIKNIKYKKSEGQSIFVDEAEEECSSITANFEHNLSLITNHVNNERNSLSNINNTHCNDRDMDITNILTHTNMTNNCSTYKNSATNYSHYNSKRIRSLSPRIFQHTYKKKYISKDTLLRKIHSSPDLSDYIRINLNASYADSDAQNHRHLTNRPQNDTYIPTELRSLSTLQRDKNVIPKSEPTESYPIEDSMSTTTINASLDKKFHTIKSPKKVNPDNVLDKYIRESDINANKIYYSTTKYQEYSVITGERSKETSNRRIESHSEKKRVLNVKDQYNENQNSSLPESLELLDFDQNSKDTNKLEPYKQSVYNSNSSKNTKEFNLLFSNEKLLKSTYNNEISKNIKKQIEVSDLETFDLSSNITETRYRKSLIDDVSVNYSDIEKANIKPYKNIKSEFDASAIANKTIEIKKNSINPDPLSSSSSSSNTTEVTKYELSNRSTLSLRTLTQPNKPATQSLSNKNNLDKELIGKENASQDNEHSFFFSDASIYQKHYINPINDKEKVFILNQSVRKTSRMNLNTKNFYYSLNIKSPTVQKIINKTSNTLNQYLKIKCLNKTYIYNKRAIFDKRYNNTKKYLLYKKEIYDNTLKKDKRQDISVNQKNIQKAFKRNSRVLKLSSYQSNDIFKNENSKSSKYYPYINKHISNNNESISKYKYRSNFIIENASNKYFNLNSTIEKDIRTNTYYNDKTYIDYQKDIKTNNRIFLRKYLEEKRRKSNFAYISRQINFQYKKYIYEKKFNIINIVNPFIYHSRNENKYYKKRHITDIYKNVNNLYKSNNIYHKSKKNSRCNTYKQFDSMKIFLKPAIDLCYTSTDKVINKKSIYQFESSYSNSSDLSNNSKEDSHNITNNGKDLFYKSNQTSHVILADESKSSSNQKKPTKGLFSRIKKNVFTSHTPTKKDPDHILLTLLSNEAVFELADWKFYAYTFPFILPPRIVGNTEDYSWYKTSSKNTNKTITDTITHSEFKSRKERLTLGTCTAPNTACRRHISNKSAYSSSQELSNRASSCSSDSSDYHSYNQNFNSSRDNSYRETDFTWVKTDVPHITFAVRADCLLNTTNWLKYLLKLVPNSSLSLWTYPLKTVPLSSVQRVLREAEIFDYFIDGFDKQIRD